MVYKPLKEHGMQGKTNGLVLEAAMQETKGCRSPLESHRFPLEKRDLFAENVIRGSEQGRTASSETAVRPSGSGLVRPCVVWTI